MKKIDRMISGITLFPRNYKIYGWYLLPDNINDIVFVKSIEHYEFDYGKLDFYMEGTAFHITIRFLYYFEIVEIFDSKKGICLEI